MLYDVVSEVKQLIKKHNAVKCHNEQKYAP